MLNGEPPKAETVAYLNRVCLHGAAGSPRGKPASNPSPRKPAGVLRSTRKNVQFFGDGTAFPRESIIDFYDQRVANIGKADTAPMP